MNQFLRIFCLYLFMLSGLPCNDSEHGHGAVPSGGETTVQSDSHGSPTHEHCADFCSPFCSCACCGCVTTTTKIAGMQLKSLLLEGSLFEFSYQSPLSTGHLSALFRPPIYTLG